jgi:hypothetical protein
MKNIIDNKRGFICDQCGANEIQPHYNKIILEGDVYMFCHIDCLKQFILEIDL